MSREEAIDLLDNLIGMVEDNHSSDYDTALQMGIKALEQEPQTGHWIVHPKGIYAHLICDKCLSNAPYDCRTDYCPNCGARMVDEQESE
jgi:hypothetical protein